MEKGWINNFLEWEDKTWHWRTYRIVFAVIFSAGALGGVALLSIAHFVSDSFIVRYSVVWSAAGVIISAVLVAAIAIWMLFGLEFLLWYFLARQPQKGEEG